MKYRKGYKYQLAEKEHFQTPLLGFSIVTEFIVLHPSGRMVIDSGYAWDGASGAIDTDTILRGSLGHDALYQLMRQRYLPQDCRKKIDDYFEELCLEDGMCTFRADYINDAVKLLAEFAADPKNIKKVYTAP